jgi:hypothetical protein
LFNMPDRDGQRRNIRDLKRDRLRLDPVGRRESRDQTKA